MRGTGKLGVSVAFFFFFYIRCVLQQWVIGKSDTSVYPCTAVAPSAQKPSGQNWNPKWPQERGGIPPSTVVNEL